MNGFDMPIKASIGKKEDIWINTSNKIKEIKLGNIDVHDFRIRDDLFLISVKKCKFAFLNLKWQKKVIEFKLF